MITRQSHSTVYVLDQEEALLFYRDRLGFEVRVDVVLDGGWRWVTVSPAGQPDLEIVLMPIAEGPALDGASAEGMRALVRAGALGIGVFETDDVHADYRRLRDRGVEFVSPPQERPYGVEAVVRDDSGNWFSLTERRG